MDIDFSDFSPFQQRVLLDMFVLALEADGQLPPANDPRFDTLFKTMGYNTEVERQREYDADQLIVLAQAFTSRPQHKKVYAAMQKAFAKDAHVSNVEIQLMSELRLRYRV